MPKTADFVMDPANPLAVFREASWDEALELAGGTLAQIRDAHGGGALAGFGSAKGSNEEAYLFQKLVRTGFGTNNVDHCTRLCHASSVAALLEGIGSGAVSNPVMDVMKAEVVLLIGANPVVNHPVAATWIKNAVKNGTKLILADPRRSELARHATHYLQFKPDTDVALLNAMMHTIVEEGLVAESLHRRSHERLRRAPQERRGPQPRGDGAGVRHPGADDPRRRAPVRDVEGLDDPVGHGNLAARARHGQRAVPDRAVADDGTGRTAGDGPASAARPEQRPGRERRRAHPDDVSGLPARGQRRRARQRSRRCGAARSTRSRGSPSSRSWTPCMPARFAACTSWARIRRCRIPTSRTRGRRWRRSRCWSCRTSFSPRPRISPMSSCRRRRFPRRPEPSPTPTAWCSSDGRRCTPPGEARPDLDDHRRHGEAARPRLALHASARGLRRDAQGDAVDRRHHLGAPRARERGHLPLRAGRRSGNARRVHRGFSDGVGPGQVRPGQGDPRRRAARQRVPVRAHHRAAARALAHGQHDAAHRSARRDRAASGGVAPFARSRGDERRRPTA